MRVTEWSRLGVFACGGHLGLLFGAFGGSALVLAETPGLDFADFHLAYHGLEVHGLDWVLKPTRHVSVELGFLGVGHAMPVAMLLQPAPALGYPYAGLLGHLEIRCTRISIPPRPAVCWLSPMSARTGR